MRNWSGNVTFGASHIHRPTSVDELRGIVAAATRIRAVGTAHSFSRVADTDADLVTLADLPRTAEVDRDASTVTVSAGTRYGDLAVTLDAAGYALHNLGSLPHISVAGACSTGTHGSGNTNGSLSTAVAALEFVTAAGDLRTIRRGDDDFDGSVVALGALGIITRVTLDVQATYQIRQFVYEDLPAVDLGAFADAYSVSLFTDWSSTRVNQAWVKRRDAQEAPATWFGGRLAERKHHPIDTVDADPTTDQSGVPGPWHLRLPHFKLEFTPSVGEELQTEYFVARADGPAALDTLDDLRDRIVPLLAITELRTIAADELWLSPAYRRDSMAIHFTWIDDEARVTALLPEIEARLAPFGARPHWGKVFTMPPAAVSPLYERMSDFARLRDAVDPQGKFRNTFIDGYAPAGSAG